jgi:uncharacterized membrane protein
VSLPEGLRLRRRYIDWARGVAVLLMLGWHTADAWTRLPDRQSAAFTWVLNLGGFAAPLFLWLAGLGVALSASRKTEVGGRPRDVAAAICQRGLELFVLAFLFRLQAFVISPGNHPVSIFRVDILNVMGLAVAGSGLLWMFGTGSTGRAVWYGVLAAGIALLTPITRTTPSVDSLPTWIQWYLRPTGDLTTFTLFPWSGFVMAGAACGVVLARSRHVRTEHRTQLAFGLAGAVLVGLGQYLSTRPSIYASSDFWTSSPTWFVMRVGILMIGVAVLHAIVEVAGRVKVECGPLERLGQSSLFVYWVHVELVYGYASWPLRHRLPLWGTIGAFAGFSLLMYGAVVVRDRIAAHLRLARRRPAPRIVPA